MIFMILYSETSQFIEHQNLCVIFSYLTYFSCFTFTKFHKLIKFMAEYFVKYLKSSAFDTLTLRLYLPKNPHEYWISILNNFPLYNRNLSYFASFTYQATTIYFLCCILFSLSFFLCAHRIFRVLYNIPNISQFSC